jgi:Flp pilus assembly protein CpaB
MRRGRIFFYLAFILLLGLVAVVVVFQRLRPGSDPTVTASGEETTPPPAVATVDVVVVSQPIARGATLSEEVLTVVPMQENLFMPGMYSAVAEVVGRQVKYDVQPNTPVLSSMLIEPGQQISQDGSVAAITIPRGMVAVSIPVDKLSTVSYAPRPGDHVNVIVTVSFVDLDPDFQSILPNNTGLVVAPGPTGESGPTNLTASINSPQGRAEIDPVLGQTIYVVPSERQRQRFVSQTLLQDAVVLQMGDFPWNDKGAAAQETPEGEAAQAEEGEAEVEQGPEIVPVTLIVSPQDAVTLNYLMATDATLALALRSAGDDSRVQTEAVTLQFLLDQYRIPIPVKLPYGFEHNQQAEAAPVP